MKNIKLGLQVHSVREAFAENPEETLRRIKEMGFTGVEIPMDAVKSANGGLTKMPVSYYKKLLEEIGLECYGILTSWADVQPDKIQETIAYNKELGSSFLVIGSVPRDLVSNIEGR